LLTTALITPMMLAMAKKVATETHVAAVVAVAVAAASQVKTQVLKAQKIQIQMKATTQISPRQTMLMAPMVKAQALRAVVAVVAVSQVAPVKLSRLQFADQLVSKRRSSAAVKVAKLVAVAHQYLANLNFWLAAKTSTV
jgi:hypothetical protein